MKVNEGAGRSAFVGLTVAAAVVLGLAAVVIPVMGGDGDERPTSHILRVTEVLRAACERHFADTGTCALEDSESSASSHHALSQGQRTAGWKGPYISQPLTRQDNPFGGLVKVYSNLGSAFQGGFRLTGSTVPSRGSGNFVRFTGIPSAVARRVNDVLDGEVDGDWKTGGRVTYIGTCLYVFLLDTDQR